MSSKCLMMLAIVLCVCTPSFATISFSSNTLTYSSPSDLGTTIDPSGLNTVATSYGITKASFQALNPQVVAFNGAPAPTQTLRTLVVNYDVSNTVTFTFPSAMYNYGSYTSYGRGAFSGSSLQDAISTVPSVSGSLNDWFDATITSTGGRGVQSLGLCAAFRNDQAVPAGQALFTLSDSTTASVTLPALGGSGNPQFVFIGYTAPSGKTITRVQASRASAVGGAWVSVDDLSFVMSAASDTTPPAAVTNLASSGATASSVTLTWTAPGDDGNTGTATTYDIRYSTSTITAGNWSSATQVSGEPAPQVAGTNQSMTVSGLAGDTTYYFAMETADEVPNWSALSNVISKKTSDTVAPAAVSNLATSSPTASSIVLSWTAPGDNGSTGTATTYDIRYSTSTITAGNWASATQVSGEPTPLVAGSNQSMTVSGLAANTTYYFAIETADEAPNWSALSNVPSGTTTSSDTTPPAAVSNLATSSPTSSSITLTWTAPGDDGNTGTATSYDIRYRTGGAVDSSNWASATQCTGEPTPLAAGNNQSFVVSGLAASTTYYFAIKTSDEVPNVSAISNSPSGTTLSPVQPVVVHNPWLKNDRVADTHNLTTMAQTYVNAYTPNGVVPPADNQAKAINIYYNQKRRLWHWADVPPNVNGYDRRDPTYNQNVFGWALCGDHSMQGCTIGQAAGFSQRDISLPGHWIYELNYDGAWHVFDTELSMWVLNKANPAKVASCQEIKNDTTLMANAVADGRACQGFLQCGDTVSWYQGAINSWTDSGTGAITAQWTGNMDLRLGQSFKRTWEAWLNQHPTPLTNADGDSYLDPPYHHEDWGDYTDTVNFPYWEPYGLTSAQGTAIHIPMNPSYRRWANGTDTLTPDFRSAGYQSSLYSSTNIKTYNDDGQTPDLHVNAVGTTAEGVFKVTLPYYITDANISGSFYRHDAGDITRLYVSTDGSTYTQVWDNTATGTTQLNNLNIRTNVFGTLAFYVKVQLQADDSNTGAGVSNLVIATTFEHNKEAMAYLDKGTNNLTFTFDNPSDLSGSNTTIHIYYKWKEYSGSDWTVDKYYETYTTTSPTNFTISVGGTKVPRTEYILVELIRAP